MKTTLFDLIKNSPTAYHATANVAAILDNLGYTRLYENTEWHITEGGKYYTVRGGSSIIAFRYNGATPFNITATHSDSPAFRVKSEERGSAYSRLGVERYGGAINYSWFDRPLAVAGRVTLRTADGIATRLVTLPGRLVIPSVPPHLDPTVNSGFSPNPARDLLPLYAAGSERTLITSIAETLGINADAIFSHDLFLTVADEPISLGAEGELILSPRIDDLAAVYSALVGFTSAAENDSTPVLAVFNNEEVGSSTKQGANSTFLSDTLTRIAGSEAKLRTLIPDSFMLSIDNAHGKHPNRPDLSDATDAPILNGGIVIKHNAEERYTTDGISSAVVTVLAERCGIKTQHYSNRADLRGGSTLGSIATTKVPLKSADIGIAQLAMHSAAETAGARDIEDVTALVREFYKTSFKECGEKLIF